MKDIFLQDRHSSPKLIPALVFCEMVFSSPKPIGIKVSFVPQSTGEHIRKIRLEKGLLQEDVAIIDWCES